MTGFLVGLALGFTLAAIGYTSQHARGLDGHRCVRCGRWWG